MKERDFLWISSAFRVASAPIVSAVLSVSVLTCCQCNESCQCIKKDPAYPKVYKVVFLIILLFFLFSLTLKKFVLFWRVEIKKGYTRTWTKTLLFHYNSRCYYAQYPFFDLLYYICKERTSAQLSYTFSYDLVAFCSCGGVYFFILFFFKILCFLCKRSFAIKNIKEQKKK